MGKKTNTVIALLLDYFYCGSFQRSTTQNKRLHEVQKQEAEMLEAKSAPLRGYLVKHVMPTLTAALIDVCKTRPDDPIDYLVCRNVGRHSIYSLRLSCLTHASSMLPSWHSLRSSLGGILVQEQREKRGYLRDNLELSINLFVVVFKICNVLLRLSLENAYEDSCRFLFKK